MRNNQRKLLLLGRGADSISSPLDLVGCVRWRDASQLNTLWQASDGTTPATNDNDVIGRWDDLSPSGAHAIQATTANKPLLKLNSRNGLSGILFDGANDYMTDSGVVTQPNTRFIVATASTSARYYYDGLSSGGRNALFRGDSASFSFFAGASMGVTTNPAVFIAGAVFDGANSFIRVNNLSQAGNAGTSAISGYTLGARNDTSSGTFLNATIYEEITYNRVLSVEEIDLVFQALNTKWAVY